MVWRPHGRAAVNPSSPRAWATCQRCGFNYNLVDLKWDYAWAGTRIVNREFLVCDECSDQLQEQLRAISLPADPVAVTNARIEPYPQDETSNRATQSGDLRVTQSGDFRITMIGTED